MENDSGNPRVIAAPRFIEALQWALIHCENRSFPRPGVNCKNPHEYWGNRTIEARKTPEIFIRHFSPCLRL